ncbi:MAG: PD40 domain-containing protein [Chthoniobacterales bacterium]|nr:PD40 domain-containing protein [Chthoniobacterales bacterium]
MKFFRILTLAGLLFPLALIAEEATITVKKGEATSISLKPFGGAEGVAAAKIVQNDLDLSGVFLLSPPERASFSVGGSAGGGSLQGTVTDHSGNTILQKTYSGNPRAAAHQFSDDIVETITGHKGIASTKIAFTSTRTGKKELYTADYDGANVKQLTNDGGISVAPGISPDGSKLAYTGYQSGYADIYLIDLHSGARNRIIKFPGTNSGAAFSPDGGRIACSISRDGNPELYVVGAGGGGARRLTKTRGVESSPSWSPDGGEIVYSSDERGGPQLFRISSGGGSGRLIPTGYSYATEPSWSPDGKKIAFTIRQGGFSVAILDLATGATRIVAQGEDPVWGADSRHIIFSNGSTLTLLDTVKGRPVPIVSGLGKVSEPTWSR